MRIRLYLDEDSAREAIVRALRSRGVDLVTAQEARLIGRSDSSQLEYATSQGRVLVTHNVADFWQLHNRYIEEGRQHAGMVLVRQQRYSVGDQMRAILRLIAVRSAEDMVGAAEFLGAWT